MGLDHGRTSGRAAAHTDTVRAVAYRPDGRELASVSDDGDLVVRDLRGGVRWKVRAHSHLVFDVSYSADGTRVVTAGGQFYMHGDRGDAAVWDADMGRELLRVTSPDGAIYAAHLSPDGTRLATGGEHQVVRIWDVRTR